MNNMSGSATSKSKRPHRIGQGVDVRMVWPSAVLDEIDQWAAAQPDKPSRSEAVLRLVQQAFACTADKPSSSRFVDALARVLLPEGNTAGLGVEVGQIPCEVRWKPRLVEATHVPSPSVQVSHVAMIAPPPAVSEKRYFRTVATPRARPVAKPAEGNEPYAMPENVSAFNEYWRRVQHVLGRHLEYEEVVVSYNRCREGVERYCEHLTASFD
jgi:hypothetical protein